MRKNSYRFALVGLLTALFSVAGLAQVRSSNVQSKYVISAKAGGVNQIVGDVSIRLASGQTRLLLRNDNIAVGDRVATGATGKVEILLNPGSYVRVGGNSEFEFVSTDLESMSLKLNKGAAIFELFASDDFLVTVAGPDSKFLVVDSGVFRLDVSESESTFSVRKGRARVGNINGELLKGGRESFGADGQFTVAKFDRGETDSLDDWSKARSKELARMLASLDNRSMRSSLMNSYLGGRWDMYNSFGVWVYNPFQGGYCFLPFGYGWSSPYGYGYGRYIGWYGLPPVVYYPPSGGGVTPTTQPPAQTTNEARSRGHRVGGAQPSQPPFSQMQRQEGKTVFQEDRGPLDFPRGRQVDSGPIFAPSAPPASSGGGKQSTGGTLVRKP